MAHDGRSSAKAIREMKQNPRYVWKGEVLGWQVRQELKRSHLMVISSRAEGGANVISEAVVAGVPVIASKIDGNVGLLGKNYRGYYPVGNTRELRKVILKAEKDKVFFQSLTKQCNSIKSKFTAEREQKSWAELISNIT
jgi:glycosyltransferase involved in cell wall biosynthesis